ncbi:MAG: nucleotidyltransferase domain-containing protein [Candidatus Micrarchaeota archaeon]
MLEKLIKSKTTVGILGILLFGSGLHIRELARRIDASPIYVKKELETLGQLGLVKSRSVGNLRVWERNEESPVYKELRGLFLKTEMVGEEIGKYFEGSDVKYAFIYGSFAKGSEKEHSDVDLFVVGKVDEKEFVESLSRSEKKLGREINYLLWEEAEFEEKAREGNYLLMTIVKNQIIWLKGDEDEFRKAVRRRSYRGN